MGWKSSLVRKLAPVLLLASISACQDAPTAAPLSTSTWESPTEAPALTATPFSQLVIVSAGEARPGAMVAQAAAETAEWAWEIRPNLPGEADAQAQRTIVVDLISSNASRLTSLAEAGVGVIAIGRDDIQASENLTVIGGALQDQAGFLAGALTAYATRTQRVGLVESETKDLLRQGFENGLRYVCPRCMLTSLPAAEAVIGSFRSAGVDVVFAMPGEDAESAGVALAQEGLWLIFVGARSEAAGAVIYRPEQLLEDALASMIRGELGRQIPLSVPNGGIAVELLHPDAFSPGRSQRVRETYAAMQSGLLVTGEDS